MPKALDRQAAALRQQVKELQDELEERDAARPDDAAELAAELDRERRRTQALVGERDGLQQQLQHLTELTGSLQEKINGLEVRGGLHKGAGSAAAHRPSYQPTTTPLRTTAPPACLRPIAMAAMPKPTTNRKAHGVLRRHTGPEGSHRTMATSWRRVPKRQTR